LINVETGNFVLQKKDYLFMIRFSIIFIIVCSGLIVFGQSSSSHVRKGNRQFGNGNFQEAEVDYRKALNNDPNFDIATYNLGASLYKQENYEESAKTFASLLEAEKKVDSELTSNTFYNLGNSFCEAQKYDEAVKAYKQSLRLNPKDMDAKYNLEYARKKLEQQQQQQEQQDKNKDKDEKNKDKQDQDKKDKQDQDKKDKQDQDQDQDKQEQDKDKDKQDQNKDQQNKEDKKDQQQKQEQNQPKEISKEDAERMLEAMKNDEKETMEKMKMQKVKGKKVKTEKDW